MACSIQTSRNEDIVLTGCVVISVDMSVDFHIDDLTFRFRFANDDRNGTHYTTLPIVGQETKSLEVTFYNVPIGDNQIGTRMLNLGHFGDKALNVKLAFTRARVDDQPDDMIMNYTWYKQI